MEIHYLEIVTKEVDAVCAAYTARMGCSLANRTLGSATLDQDSRHNA